MGLPKQFKTGAVVGSYPKPLLYIGFDRGGLDVIPSPGATKGPTDVLMDCTTADVTYFKPGDISTCLLAPQQPKISAFDFTTCSPKVLTMDFKPEASQLQYQEFIKFYNTLVAAKTFPWKTLVFDGATGFTDAVLNAISSVNPAAMLDARQWAGMAGGTLRKTILSMTQLPCHVVVLLHSFIDKDETTGVISEKPNVYSQVLRDDFFGLFSQCFYSVKDAAGNPKVWPSDKYPVKGIGCRWPQGLPKECGPDYTSIYGKEVL
jgi:hypothetical protein